MGRIRTIKPELLEDDVTANLSHLEWRLFVSLLLLADDHGNLRGDPAYIRGATLWAARHDRDEVAAALMTLVREELLACYRVRGQVYMHISGWEKHQKVTHRGRPRMPLLTDENSERLHVVAGSSGESQENVLRVSGESQESLRLDLRSPTSDHDPDRDPRARAIPPAQPEPTPQEPQSPDQAQPEDRSPPALTAGHEQDLARLDRDRWCTAKWDEVNAHRARIAKLFDLRDVQQLHPQDRGRTELALRVRDGGDDAKRQVEHVIRVRVAEAEATRSVRWLAGSMFDRDGEQFRNALAMTPDDAARPKSARAGPTSALVAEPPRRIPKLGS